MRVLEHCSACQIFKAYLCCCNIELRRQEDNLLFHNAILYIKTKIIRAFWLVRNLLFILPVKSEKTLSYFIKVIDHTFTHFLWVSQRDNPHGMQWENTRKACKSPAAYCLNIFYWWETSLTLDSIARNGKNKWKLFKKVTK